MQQHTHACTRWRPFQPLPQQKPRGHLASDPIRSDYGRLQNRRRSTLTGDLSNAPVRGQDFTGFTSSIKGLDADPTAKQTFDLYAKKDGAALEKLFNEKGLNDGWPPNRGFIDLLPCTMEAPEPNPKPQEIN